MRKALWAVAVVVVVGGGPVEASSELPEIPVGAQQTAQDEGDVEVADNEFVPDELTVAVGTTVTWAQTGSNPHSVTASDGSFDSHPNCTPACMGPGDTYEVTFDEAGTVPYYCKVHGTSEGAGMAGVITVEAAASDDDEQPAPAQDDDAQVLGSGDSNTPQAPQVTAPDDDPLPITGGPGPSVAVGSAMLVVAAAGRRFLCEA